MTPQFQPMLLGSRAEAFTHPDWLFELKYDGFRALAFVQDGACRVVSRNGNTFKSFEELSLVLPEDLLVSSAVLDGEIVCLDRKGRPNFDDLFYRRRTPVFAAFDLLAVEGTDVRYLPLCARKTELRRILRSGGVSTLYCSHVERDGAELFRLACEHDLEGIVAKYRYGQYVAGREETTWFKIRNRTYSQWEGRDEMFERPHEPVGSGWDRCSIAAAI